MMVSVEELSTAQRSKRLDGVVVLFPHFDENLSLIFHCHSHSTWIRFREQLTRLDRTLILPIPLTTLCPTIARRVIRIDFRHQNFAVISS